jgi:hypothetical protein
MILDRPSIKSVGVKLENQDNPMKIFNKMEVGNMPCPNSKLVKIKELSPELLEDLTRINALDYYEENGDPDPLKNWIKGKKHTAFTIIERYLHDCTGENKCLPLPDYFFEYLNEIDINDIKEFKAYFVWKAKGRNENNTAKEMSEDYYDACDRLMDFCDQLKDKKLECGYNDILTLIDRRCGGERRNLTDRRKAKKRSPIERRSLNDRRSISERRVFDHRGLAASYL